MKHRLAWLLVPIVVVLAGCGERYRYPCQDPVNWHKQECQKPYCSANGTCPEDLRHYEKNEIRPPAAVPGIPMPPRSSQDKGDCNKC
jgi:hypothetical protein